VAAGAIDLAQAGGGGRWLAWAAALQRRMGDLFWDEARGCAAARH